MPTTLPNNPNAYALAPVRKDQRVNNVLWFICATICVLLGLRFVFLLLGANNVGLALFLYNLTDIFIAPFTGVFDTPQFGESFFSTPSLLGIVMYLLLTLGLTKVVTLTYTKGETTE